MERKRQMDDNIPLEPPPKRRTSTPLGHNRIVAPALPSAATPRMCEVCGEDKSINSFPNATQVSSHDHEYDVCHECFTMHLDVEVDSKMWDQISCPQCPSLLQQHEIQNLATPECFAKYARFARRAALSSNPDYRYCFSTSCSQCQHQFCWACLADFILIARYGLHNHHPDCPNHRPAGDINEDMIAHAGAMLLMANGRFQEMLEEVFGFRLQ
ncbi:hypothetical protein D6C84_02879 [Aureobasidium pullulans]|uniref:RING-type domain-containing protein n=1 Tax=Aureobasidium pullulans TaxID=5580 RepID=A0A4S9Y516_AURPU|nr:hypothetical protein D6C84_02879 [Aureobasidium pullulans]